MTLHLWMESGNFMFWSELKLSRLIIKYYDRLHHIHSLSLLVKISVIYSDWTIIDPVWGPVSSLCLLDEVSFRYFLDSLGEEHNTRGASWIPPLVVVVSVTLSLP